MFTPVLEALRLPEGPCRRSSTSHGSGFEHALPQQPGRGIRRHVRDRGRTAACARATRTASSASRSSTATFFAPGERQPLGGALRADVEARAARTRSTLNFSKRIAIDQGFSRTFINAHRRRRRPGLPVASGTTASSTRRRSSRTTSRPRSSGGARCRPRATRRSSCRATSSRSARTCWGRCGREFEEPDDSLRYPPSDPRRDRLLLRHRRRQHLAGPAHDTPAACSGAVHAAARAATRSSSGSTTSSRPCSTSPSRTRGCSIPTASAARTTCGSVHPMDRRPLRARPARVRGLHRQHRPARRLLVHGPRGREGADTTPTTPTSRRRRAPSSTTTRSSFFGRRYKMHLSPRVIVAHPITENSSFFFNYGQFTQNPSYRYVYSKLDVGLERVVPAARQPEPEPAGVDQLRGRRQAPVPAHGRGQRDVLRQGRLRLPDARRTFKRQQGTSLVDFFVYLNGHFARSKGFEIELEKRRSELLVGQAHVHVSSRPRGKSSDPNEQKVVQEGERRRGRDAAVGDVRELEPPAQAVGELRPAFRPATTRRAARVGEEHGVNLFIRGPVGTSVHAGRRARRRGSASRNSANGAVQFLDRHAHRPCVRDRRPALHAGPVGHEHRSATV